jgi:putative ABC transport system substrate-binding protein
LRDRGYVEGQNLILELRSLNGKIERASGVMAELVRLGVDVIVSTGPEMTREAQRVTTAVPIVMLSREPVEEGLVASLARPGGNVTGMTRDTGPDMESKRLDLLRQGIPTLRRVAYLGLKAEWAAPAGRNLRSAAGASGVTLFLAERGANDYTKAFDLIARERPQAIIVSQTVFHFTHRSLIANFAATHKLPSMVGYREFVEAGALMSYGSDLVDIYRRLAIYVDKILKGAKPGDLPIEQPSKFELIINLKTAKALGLKIPPSLLARADQVIE